MRPGRAMASSSVRNTAAASIAGSAKPAPVGIASDIAAHHGEEIDLGGSALGAPRAQLLLAPRLERHDDPVEQLKPVVWMLQHGIEERRQPGVIAIAAGDIAMTDRSLGEAYAAPRDRHLADIERCARAADPAAHHDEAGLGRPER